MTCSNSDFKAALGCLSNEYVHPLLNESKLVSSEVFENIASMAIEHAILHGDTTLMERTVFLLKTQELRIGVAAWMAKKLGATASISSESVKFKKRDLRVASILPLRQYLKGLKQAPPEVLKSEVSVVHLRREQSFAKPYIDMLDHPARLPGSFEGGKRR